jgi:MFS transporter, DHA3 family, tetracycline resistance protein
MARCLSGREPLKESAALERLSATTVYLASELWLSFAWAISFTVTAVYFVAEVGLDPFQLVLVGTVMELTILVFEIPTGVVADTYSRRLSLLLGWAVMGLGMIIVGASDSFPVILGGYATWGFGYTFTSGANEAWITDEVGVAAVGRLFVRGQQLGYIGGLAGIGVSVAVASVELSWAIMLGGVLAIGFAVFAAAVMPERGFQRRPRAERGSALREARTTTARGGAYVRTSPLLLLIFGIAFFAGASTESFDRLWQAHMIRDVGLPGIGSLDPVVWFGIFGAGSTVIGLAASQVLIKHMEKADRAWLTRLLFLFTFAQCVAVLAFAVTGHLWPALTAFWLYYLTRSLIDPVFMTWVNENITDSSVRATVISISGQSDAIGQVIGGPALGGLGSIYSLRTALVAGGALLLPALGLYGRALRHGGRSPELDSLPSERA